MILAYKEMEFLYVSDTNQLTTEYLRKNNPDVIICLYYPENLLKNDSAFTFDI